jgi:hypothetical protein
MTQEIFLSFSFFNLQNLDAAGIFLTHTHRQYFFVRARVR